MLSAYISNRFSRKKNGDAVVCGRGIRSLTFDAGSSAVTPESFEPLLIGYVIIRCDEARRLHGQGCEAGSRLFEQLASPPLLAQSCCIKYLYQELSIEIHVECTNRRMNFCSLERGGQVHGVEKSARCHAEGPTTTLFRITTIYSNASAARETRKEGSCSFPGSSRDFEEKDEDESIAS